MIFDGRPLPGLKNDEILDKTQTHFIQGGAYILLKIYFFLICILMKSSEISRWASEGSHWPVRDLTDLTGQWGIPHWSVPSRPKSPYGDFGRLGTDFHPSALSSTTRQAEIN